LTISSDGPAKTGVDALPTAEREALHSDWVDYFECHRVDGGVSIPRPYFVLLGRRR
jgi:hypothetical protein